MAARVGPITEQVSQAQIDALGERMDRGFGEIKELVRGYEERLRGMETREAGCAPLMNSRLDAAWRKLDSHEAELDKLRVNLNRMAKTAGQLEAVAKWLLGIATALIISILVAFLTGKIDIVFR